MEVQEAYLSEEDEASGSLLIYICGFIMFYTTGGNYSI